MLYQTEIVGSGMYVPHNIVTNADLEKLMETSDEWIQKRTGIKERRWVSADQGTSDLALEASLKAIENAKIKKEEIELIIFASISSDHEFPGGGCFLQAKLGLSEIPALDIRQQCTGFIYGMSIADHFIRLGTYKTVLLVGAEIHSKGLDKTTRGRDVSVLFGDGAGAVVLRRTEVKDNKKSSYIHSTHLYTEGAFAKELWTPAPGSAAGFSERINSQMLAEGLHYPYMNGKKVFTHAIRRMCECLLTCLQKNNVTLDDVDLFLFHQANMRINEMVAQELKIPTHKVFNTIQKYGNTTAATLPIGMDEAVRAGVLKKGMLVGSAAFGSGFTWGSALYRW